MTVVMPPRTALTPTNYRGVYQTSALQAAGCRYTAACPSCHTDATWTTAPTGTGASPGFALIAILCPVCDRLAELAA